MQRNRNSLSSPAFHSKPWTGYSDRQSGNLLRGIQNPLSRLPQAPHHQRPNFNLHLRNRRPTTTNSCTSASASQCPNQPPVPLAPFSLQLPHPSHPCLSPQSPNPSSHTPKKCPAANSSTLPTTANRSAGSSTTCGGTEKREAARAIGKRGRSARS